MPIRLFKFFLCLLLLNSVSYQMTAQDEADEDEPEINTKAKNTLPPFHDSVFRFAPQIPNPKKAGMYSALIPGLGQVYNRQYWKVGVVAVATGAVAGFLVFNTKKYNIYQKAYFGRIDTDPTTTDTFTNYQLSDLDLLRKTYRTYVEYTVIAGTVCYLLNILDAFTSAHMKTFDMSKNLSFQFAPMLDSKKQFGIKLSIAKK